MFARWKANSWKVLMNTFWGVILDSSLESLHTHDKWNSAHISCRIVMCAQCTCALSAFESTDLSLGNMVCSEVTIYIFLMMFAKFPWNFLLKKFFLKECYSEVIKKLATIMGTLNMTICYLQIFLLVVILYSRDNNQQL